MFMCMSACMSAYTHTVQRTTCRSQFSFSTGVLGIELRSSVLREAPCRSYLSSPSLVGVLTMKESV